MHNFIELVDKIDIFIYRINSIDRMAIGVIDSDFIEQVDGNEGGEC